VDNTERNEYLADEYRKGRTLEELGREVGITRERVRQIVAKYGAKSSEGGASKRAEDRKAKILSERDQRYLQKYGLTRQEYVEARDAGYQKAWAEQKRNAQRRKIGWELSLKDFSEAWEGKFHLRGKRRDALVMTRIDLDQPFTKDNVKIVTLAESARQNINRMHNND
jgi:hypothetical protein